MTKLVLPIVLMMFLLMISCNKKTTLKNSSQPIFRKSQQDSIFTQLMALTGNKIDTLKRLDSLSFLIIPLMHSCPSCRDKALDSIIKYRKKIGEHQYIILSANGGIKTMRTYFTDRKRKMPVINDHLFLDSINKAIEFGLYENNPSLYYTVNGMAYWKVLTLPATIKEDLHIFFSQK